MPDAQEIWEFFVGEVGVSFAVLLAAGLVGLAAHWLLWRVLRLAVREERMATAASVVSRTERPMRLLLPLIAAQVVIPGLRLGAFDEPMRRLLGILLILGLGWLATRATLVMDDVVGRRYRVDLSDNLSARRMHTLVKVVRRVAVVLIWMIVGASALMVFPRASQLGASLLASAGIAGVVIGLAAKPTLSNLIAGLQIAATQPIRLDDVVVINGEWGRIEEITTTYVVVRVWDERRLIVPLNDFIEKPFQNWTRTTSAVLGFAMVYTDFETPVEAVREELRRIVSASELWDGRVCVLQVTNTSPEGMELRALVSAADAGKAFELRCVVREALVAFLRRDYPRSLARRRVEMIGDSPGGSGAIAQGVSAG
ncbi:MAG: mechanosensitive ion channel [Phycisphaeraceae bacterium]|nr:mechanosensitive ion channel [Phycisphaerae bacterium]MBX3391573.1 mechanosensitive ion channel [Phycisphaeraceae bacterium]